MYRKHLPVLLVFILVILGCRSTETIESTKVDASEIYQNYYISGDRNSTNVTATFRVSGSTGSTIDLDAPAKIEHNNKEMLESKPGFMKGTDYQDSANNFISNHSFKFTDADGKIWENSIRLDALEITSQNIVISLKKGGFIGLSRPLGNDENIEINLISEKLPPANSNTNNNSSTEVYSTFLQYDLDESRKNVQIKTSSLKDFVEGKAHLEVKISKESKVLQSAKGGSIIFVYEAQNVSANVVD